jgi:hypothetical protein
MRYLIFNLFFNLPCIARATISIQVTQMGVSSTPSSVSLKRTLHKNSLFNHFVRKTAQKRMLKTMAQWNGHPGKWLLISGFTIGVLVVLASLPPLSFALFLDFGLAYLILLISLSLSGLALSILGMKKVAGWEQTKRLIIAGMVLNSLVILFGLLLIGGA